MNSVVVLIVHFLTYFLFGCKGRESECLSTVHKSYRGGLGAALARLNGVTIRTVHKGNSDVWKQSDWPGITSTSNVKMYASGPWFVYKWKSWFEAFCWANFFLKICRVSIFFLLWDGSERCGQRNVGFQNGRTGRNAIAFRNILRRKKAWKPGQLKGLHYSPGPTLSGTRPWGK